MKLTLSHSHVPPHFPDHGNKSTEPHYHEEKQCFCPGRMGSQVQRDTWPPQAGVMGQELLLPRCKQECSNEAVSSSIAPVHGRALKWEAKLQTGPVSSK